MRDLGQSFPVIGKNTFLYIVYMCNDSSVFGRARGDVTKPRVSWHEAQRDSKTSERTVMASRNRKSLNKKLVSHFSF